MVQNSESILISPSAKAKKKKVNIDALREKDAQKVRGVFHWLENPGGVFSFVFRQYKGEPVMRYSLKDGETYELPLGVARHLNNNVGRFEHVHLLDKDGKPSQLAKRRIRRVSFESLDFMDYEDIGSQRIEEVTIENLPPIAS